MHSDDPILSFRVQNVEKLITHEQQTDLQPVATGFNLASSKTSPGIGLKDNLVDTVVCVRACVRACVRVCYILGRLYARHITPFKSTPHIS